jgi:hypothetical protein
MQGENWTHLEFTARTDVLASHLACDLDIVANLMGVSRSSLFAYRSNKSKITRKAWSKLEHAEREAGLSPSLREQLITASDEITRTRLLESADLVELAEVAGQKMTRELLTKQQLTWFKVFAEHFFVQSACLAEMAGKAARSLSDKELSADLRHFSKVVKQDGPTVEEWVRILIAQLKPLSKTDAAIEADKEIQSL